MNKKAEIIMDVLETLASSFVFFLLVYTFLAFPEVVHGASMEPNLHTKERILVEKISKYFNDFERGDIVILNPPGNDMDDYVKRVIGLPGEIVKIYDCKVYVTKGENKFILNEQYISKSVCTKGGGAVLEGRSTKIDEDYYLVLGDNRENSLDSRVFGLVPKERILGKVCLRFWPPNKFKIY